MFNQPLPLRVFLRIGGLLFAMVVLSQCSHISSVAPSDTAQDKMTAMPEKAAIDSYHSAATPLNDIGLREDEIPELLKANMDQPYAHPARFDCVAATVEIVNLDAILGPDVDAPREDKNERNGFAIDGDTIFGRGVDFAHDSVVDFVRGQTNILPFRSVIRTVTGAKHHEKEVKRAQEAGQLRRAYLKGMLAATGKCTGPLIKPGPHIQEASVEAPSFPESLWPFGK